MITENKQKNPKLNNTSKADKEFEKGFDDAVSGKSPKGSSKNYFAGYQKGFEMANAVGLNKKRVAKS